MTSYETIYEKFLSKIEDYDFAQWDEDQQTESLANWIDSALAIMETESISPESDLDDRDDDSETFNIDLKKYEIEIIALYMVVAWYEPRVNSLEHTLAFFGSKDEKYTNQKDHLKVIKDVQESYRIRARKMYRNRSTLNNTYLNGDEENA